MKRNFTSLLAIAILVITSGKAFSQADCSMSTTNPNPSPALGSSLAVTSLNGFTSPDQSPVGDFSKGTTTTLVSPVYSYPYAQTETYFKYHLATTASTSTITGYSISLIIEGGITLSCSNTVSFGVNSTGADYYFMLDPADAIPAGKYFKIVLTLTIAGGGNKDVIASAFQSNGQLAPAGISLPVKFSSFEATASGSTNYLTWNVGTEENLSGYQVERSVDGRNFSNIGFVSAAGNSSYSYVDNKPASTSYYRIKSVDIDGKYGYSTVAVVKTGSSSIVMKAFPMPITSKLTIQHSTATAGSNIMLSTADGRIIKTIVPAAGSQQTEIDLSSVKAGLYLVRYSAPGESATLKLIKQ
jgi:hypothetical protein